MWNVFLAENKWTTDGKRESSEIVTSEIFLFIGHKGHSFVDCSHYSLRYDATWKKKNPPNQAPNNSSSPLSLANWLLLLFYALSSRVTSSSFSWPLFLLYSLSFSLIYLTYFLILHFSRFFSFLLFFSSY